MLTPTALILLATAFVAGVTGAWSPCGFSMVETLGSRRQHAGARTVRTSCATFALGALAGGVAMFGTIAALGAVLGGPARTVGLLVVIAVLAALGDLFAVAVRPQIRRQVPEPWRRTMPLPLAAGLYGVLLGLGFTTFVLALAIWALAGIAFSLGDPAAGLLIGLGFGAGRALPVVLMVPRYDTLGRRLELAMAERPSLLRGLRLVDGALLAVLAVAFLWSGDASAATRTPVADDATDPSLAADGTLAFRVPGGPLALIAPGGARRDLQGENVAAGGRYVATRAGDTLSVFDAASGALVAQRSAPGTTQLAISDGWLVWRATRAGGGDRLYASALPALADTQLVAGVRDRERIGRPMLDGDRLVYAVATQHGSRIVLERLGGGSEHRRTLLRDRLAELSQPALQGRRLLYVQATFCSQRLRVIRLGSRRPGRTLLRLGTTARRDPGHEPSFTTQGSEPTQCPAGTPRRTDTILWTTALAAHDAYVTLLNPQADGTTRPRLVRVRA